MNLEWLRGNPLPWKLRKVLYERAIAQMENRLSLERVLTKFRKALARRNKHRAAAAIENVERRVQNGDTLVTAMGNSITGIERTVLSAGVRSGTVAQSMQLILNVREMVERIGFRLMVGFAPALVYSYALYKVLRFIGMDVIPEFETSLPAERWTGWARVLYLMGHAASGVALPMLAWSIAGYSIWCVWALPSWAGKGRTFFDNWVFPFPLYREITGFVWLLSFLALQRAKVDPVSALVTQIRTASPWLASRLDPLRDMLEDGDTLSVAMQKAGHGFPSEDLIDDIGEYGDFASSAAKLENSDVANSTAKPDGSEATDPTSRLQKAAEAHSRHLERKVLFIGGGMAFALSLLVYAAMFIMQLASNSLSAGLTAAMRHM